MPSWLKASPWWMWPTVALVVLAAAASGVVIGRGGAGSATQELADAVGQTAGPVQWRKLQLPVADIWMPFGGDGPRVDRVGEWSGWSHTEAGAVQAGWMWLVCGALDNSAAAQCVRSHYTGALTESLANLYVSRAPVPREEVKPYGYEVLAFTPGSARVVYRTEGGSTMIVTLTWADGDWKILADSESSRPRNAAQVAPGEKFDLTAWGPTDG